MPSRAVQLRELAHSYRIADVKMQIAEAVFSPLIRIELSLSLDCPIIVAYVEGDCLDANAKYPPQIEGCEIVYIPEGYVNNTFEYVNSALECE